MRLYRVGAVLVIKATRACCTVVERLLTGNASGCLAGAVHRLDQVIDVAGCRCRWTDVGTTFMIQGYMIQERVSRFRTEYQTVYWVGGHGISSTLSRHVNVFLESIMHTYVDAIRMTYTARCCCSTCWYSTQ
jgi:hypothetical protein